MRDKNRIPIVGGKLIQAWSFVPDWRLGQLVSNLQGPGRHDVFQMEDDQWEELLDNFISQYKE